MIQWINRLLGTRYWYSIEITYLIKTKGIFSFTGIVGMTSKKNILNNRSTAKTFHKQITHQSTRHLLNNGSLSVKIYGYLGWTKAEKNLTK